MNEATSTRSSGPPRGCLVAIWLGVAVLALPLGGLRLSGMYREYRYMAEYRALERQRATESQIVASQGAGPWFVYASQDARQKDTRKWHPRTPFNLRPGEKALAYPADPWDDGEGVIVLLVLDIHGRLRLATLAL